MNCCTPLPYHGLSMYVEFPLRLRIHQRFYRSILSVWFNTERVEGAVEGCGKRNGAATVV